MKNILKIALLLISVPLYSQNLEEKMAQEICSCLSDFEKLKDPEEKIQNCFHKSFENNYDEVYAKLNDPQNTKTKDFGDYFVSVEGQVLKDCKKFLTYRQKGLVRASQQSISNCEELKTGVYYYEILKGRERAYLTFTKDKLIETRSNNVSTTSKIEWINACTYKLTLIHSNSNYDTHYLKNKSLVFKIIENNPNYFVVQTEFFENGILNNLKIYKLPYINERTTK